ncbi:MAG: hypothetical protein WCB15_20760 [Desulfobacterales bacterium]
MNFPDSKGRYVTLDAWFQFSPEPPELNIDPTARIGPDMTIDDIFFIVFDFDAAL